MPNSSIIVVILLFIFGMGITGAPICIAAGLLSDFVARSGKYKKWSGTAIRYVVFCLSNYLPLVLTADTYKQSLFESGYEQAFVELQKLQLTQLMSTKK